MSKANELTGQRFGRLTVIERAGSNKKGNTIWRCRCDCGKETIVVGYTLKNGHSQSCGCLHHERVADRNHLEKRTHGETHTRLYSIWRGMRTRCNVESSEHYPDYGGRGIRVCAEWNGSFEAFRDWALSNGYDDTLSIDRIDNDRGYEPSNCRWATMSQQNSNRRHYKWKRNRR